MPKSDFYNRQLQQLENFRPAAKQYQQKSLPLGTEAFADFLSQASLKPKTTIKVPAQITDVEQLVAITLAVNSKARQQRHLQQTARFHLSQTQALEPLLQQFAGFMQQNPVLSPLTKQFPAPGLTALKLNIARNIALEANAKLQLFLAKLALRTRVLAHELIKNNRQLLLQKQTIVLYKDLLQSSQSLYRNGKVSFAELTMISVELQKLNSDTNLLLARHSSLSQQIYALLDGKQPKLALTSSINLNLNISEQDLANHPELKVAQLSLQRNELSKNLIERMALPDFTSISSLPGQKNQSTANSLPAAKAIKDSNIEFSRIFAAQLHTKIGAEKANVRQIKSNLQTELTARRQSFRLIGKNLKIIRQQMIPELEKAFHSVKSGYESGEAGFQELVEAERRLLKLRNQLIESEFAYARLQAQILFALGKTNY
jgi:outer membrane protein TolC